VVHTIQANVVALSKAIGNVALPDGVDLHAVEVSDGNRVGERLI